MVTVFLKVGENHVESTELLVRFWLYPSRIGFRFSEPDFTKNFDFSQSQNPHLDSTKAPVLFNRKIKISGKRVLAFQDQTGPEIPKTNS